MFYVPSLAGEIRGEQLGEFESRSVKTQDALEGIHLLENSHNLDTVNSHNLKTANHIAHDIFVLHSAMKTH